MANLAALAALAATGCNSDCIYKNYTNRDGDELCGRFCPVSDTEGNDVVNTDNEPIYKLDSTVNNINCNPPSGSATSTSTSTSSSSSSTTSSGTN